MRETYLGYLSKCRCLGHAPALLAVGAWSLHFKERPQVILEPWGGAPHFERNRAGDTACSLNPHSKGAAFGREASPEPGREGAAVEWGQPPATSCAPQGWGCHQARQAALPQDPEAHQCHQRLHPDQLPAGGVWRHLPHQQLTRPGTRFRPPRSLPPRTPPKGRFTCLPGSMVLIFWVCFLGTGWSGVGVPLHLTHPTSCLHTCPSPLPSLFLVSVCHLRPAHHGPGFLPLSLWQPLCCSVSQPALCCLPELSPIARESQSRESKGPQTPPFLPPSTASLEC